MFRFTLTIIAACIGVSTNAVNIEYLTFLDMVTFYGEGLFFDDGDDMRVLSYVDNYLNTEFKYDFKTQQWRERIFQEYENFGAGLTFVYPTFKYDEKQELIVVGTEKFISLAQNHIDYVPVAFAVISADFKIVRAHAEPLNSLFIAANSREDNGGAQLYKFSRKELVLVKEYNSYIIDFAWTHEETSMYLIKDNGKTIVKYDYDKSKKEISNERVVFTLPAQGGSDEKMTGIETDNHKNHLWVVTNSGKLLEIQDDKIIDTIGLPLRELTGITFGGLDNSGLIISSAQDRGYAAIIYVTGINSTGIADPRVRWTRR